MGGWTTSITTCGVTPSTASASFEDGPATPPLGPGSARLRVGSDGSSVASLRYAAPSALIADIAALAYSTYVTTNLDSQAPYLRIDVDLDADGDAEDALFFEPAYQTHASGSPSLPDQGALTEGVWQSWDARAGGWWANATPGFSPGTGVASLAAYAAARPGSRIATDGIRVAAGCGTPSWDGFDGAADAVRIALPSIDVTFDFEPDPIVPDTILLAGPTGTVSDAVARFEFNATESATFACAIDGGPAAACASPFETAVLTDGAHTFSVRATDLAGNTDPTPAVRAWTIDTPPAPIIGAPADGAFLRISNVRVSGTATPGMRVLISEGVTLIGDVPVDAQGRWSLDRAFANGAHTVVAWARDGVNDGPRSAPRTFTVDTVPPGAPTLTAPLADQLVGPNVVIRGSSEPAARVTITEGEAVLGSTTADAQGAFELDIRLPGGRHVVRARAADRAGNEGPLSSTLAFDVDADPPGVTIDTQGNAVLVSPAGLTGRATDTSGVARVELTYHDIVLNRVAGYETAACTGCGVRGVTATWTAAAAVRPGYYLAGVTAIDVFGNRSPAAYVTFVRL